MASVILDDVATVDTGSAGIVKLSLVVSKDCMVAKSWDSHKFCPATLIQQLKPDDGGVKKGKGKGKGKNKPAKKPTGPTIDLKLVEEVQRIDAVSMRTFALCGTVPALTDTAGGEGTPPAEGIAGPQVISLTGPSLKRPSDAPSTRTAKKLKATAAIIY